MIGLPCTQTIAENTYLPNSNDDVAFLMPGVDIGMGGHHLRKIKTAVNHWMEIASRSEIDNPTQDIDRL
jgi:hypothetical protein